MLVVSNHRKTMLHSKSHSFGDKPNYMVCEAIQPPDFIGNLINERKPMYLSMVKGA